RARAQGLAGPARDEQRGDYPPSRQRGDRGTRADGQYRRGQRAGASCGQDAAQLRQSAGSGRNQQMPRFLIAVTDSPFPSLDPAKAALARVDPDLRMAKTPSTDDILAVARDADAVFVTYAKLPRELLTQLTSCKVIARFGLR